MSAADVDRLLWDLVDGTLGADDRARLEAHLAGHPEDRLRLNRIRAMGELFAPTAEVDPPPALRQGIERALASRRLERPARWRVALRELAAPSWSVRLAWAAVGLAFGAGVVSLMLSDLGRVAGRDETKFYGAMRQPSKEGGAAGLALAVPPSVGRLSVLRQDGELTFDLVVQEVPGGVTLELAADGMELAGFSEVGASASSLKTAAGRVTLTVRDSGRIKVSVGAGSGGRVSVRLIARGAPVLDRTVANEEVPGR